MIGRTPDGESLKKSQGGYIILPVRYHWGGIIELEVPPNETLGLMTLHLHNTNKIQNTMYAKALYLPDTSNTGQKQYVWNEYGQSFQIVHLHSEGLL